MTKQSNLQVANSHALDAQDELLRRVADIAEQLEALKAAVLTSAPSPGDESPNVTATRIRRQLKARRARAQFLGENLFADPAWDILLEAYASYLLEQRTSVTALCNAAAVPGTTALRWIRKLEQDGLLVRHGDTEDGRRQWIELSPAAAVMMRNYLDAISVTLPL